jgi:sulfur carrier protein
MIPLMGIIFTAMRVRINGKERELPEATTLLQLLQERGLDPRMVVIEHNYEIVPRERYDEIVLREGDNLEIVQMVAGG